MAKNPASFRKQIAKAMSAVLERARKQEGDEGRIDLDIRRARLILLSDQHKGKRDAADDFLLCERAYNAALAYYDRLRYSLFLLGDVEELWEEWPETVVNAYKHTLELEGRFHRDGRCIRIWGNHDDAWSHPDLVEQWLVPALGVSSVRVRETLLLHIRDGEEELGRLLLVHGHQGTFSSDQIAPLSRLLARYVWRPIQRTFKIKVNTPATDFELRYAHESAMYAWSQDQEKLVLIAGHTHRPVFKSRSQEEILREALAEAEEQLSKDPGNARLHQRVAELAAGLEWALAQNQLAPKDIPTIEFKKPSYFNTGCCAFRDGDITGLELSDGEIRLVRWPDDEDRPLPKVLAQAKLKDVFAAC